MFGDEGCENSFRFSSLPSFCFLLQNFDQLIAKFKLTVIYLAFQE